MASHFAPQQVVDRLRLTMQITDWLAVYAAVLSTAVFGWNINRSMPKFTVDLVMGLDATEEGNTQAGVYIFIRNHSSHTVHIASVSIQYPYREVTVWEKLAFPFKYRRFDRYVGWVHCNLLNFDVVTGLPTSIEPGKSHHIFVPDAQLINVLTEDGVTKFVAVAQDALWRNKYSRVYKIPQS